MRSEQIRDLPTSVYAALMVDEALWLGGSEWDRRNTLYEDIDADDILGRLWTGQETMRLPNMVYCLLRINGDVYVGMKRSPTHMLLDTKGRVKRRCEDDVSDGVYNAVRDADSIVCATRSGDIIRLEHESFTVTNRRSLTDSRLWALEKTPGGFVCGDYDGRVFCVNDSFDTVASADLRELHDDERLAEGFGPSAWDAVVRGDNIVMVDRWGGVTTLSLELDVVDFDTSGYSFTTVTSYDDTLVFGDRYGRLLSYDESFGVIAKHEPTKQKENAIWCLNHVSAGIVACFADGQVEHVTGSVSA